MDRCVIHEWQPRGEKSVCMSCGAELDRPPVQYSRIHSSGAKPHQSRREQRQAYRNHPTEVIIYRPRPAKTS